MKRPMISGKSVDEVKKRKVNGLIPSFSYHFKVKAMSNKAAKAMTKSDIVTRVLVSVFRRKIEYTKIPTVLNTDPTMANTEY